MTLHFFTSLLLPDFSMSLYRCPTDTVVHLWLPGDFSYSRRWVLQKGCDRGEAEKPDEQRGAWMMMDRS